MKKQGKVGTSMRKQAVAVMSIKNVALKNALQLNLEKKNVSLNRCDTERKLLAPMDGRNYSKAVFE